MRALDRDIRSSAHGAQRQIGMKTEMRSVGFIDEQKFSRLMHDAFGFRQIEAKALVGRVGEQHGGRVRIVEQSLSYLFGFDGEHQVEFRGYFRLNEYRGRPR